MRRRTLVLGAAIVLGAAGAAALIVARGSSSDAAGSSTSPPLDRHLATVEQRDLKRRATLDGTVSHGASAPLALPGSGTLTRLPSVGDVVASGQVLAEVNGAPVLLLAGERPVWRDLGPGTGDGEDVRQLEQALSDLGFAASGLTVDAKWTSATTASVKAMQKALGMEQDGKLALGEVVFAPAAVRIATVGGHLGDDAGAAGIEVTGEVQVVQAKAKVKQADLVAPGTEVTVELPSGRDVPGVVYAVGAPTTDSGNATTLPVTVLADGLDALDGLSVDVLIDTVDVAGATAVPAEALLALAEGGYALEVPDAASASGTRLVGVEIGVFDEDGWVQVTGDVQPGDQVVVP